jgi:hypothetical protein
VPSQRKSDIPNIRSIGIPIDLAPPPNPPPPPLPVLLPPRPNCCRTPPPDILCLSCGPLGASLCERGESVSNV